MTAQAAAGERSLHGRPARYARGFVEVATGTYAWLQPNGDWSESNAGLVVGDGAAALIDTTWDLRLTRRLLDAVAQQTEHPITTLFVTHADGDHVNGCQLLAESELIASTAAAAEMQHEDPQGLRRSHLGCRLLRTVAVGPPRRFGAYVGAMLDPFDFRGITIRQPDRTFDRDLTLEVGGRQLELRRLGPAHTAGDAIAHLPHEGVVFAGDLLFTGVTPNTWTGDIAGWRRALAQIAALDPRVVVPGHGPVGGVEAVWELDRYWSWLEAHALPRLRGGQSVAEAARAIVLGDHFANEPWATWESPERTVANLIAIDRTRRGVSPVITHRERPRVMWQVAWLAAQIEEQRRTGPS